jgi:hypothetical protein
MAKSILAAPACPHNPTFLYQDTSGLTELFLWAYQYHLDRSEQEIGTFLQKLEQLVALGYKACRQYPHRRQIYNAYRQQFLQYDNGDFRKHLSLVDIFVQSLAKMAQWALQSYQSLGYPDDYETFLQLLEAALKPEKMASLSQQTAAYQLLAELKQLY